MSKYEDELWKYSTKASQEDIHKITTNIGRMKRGPIGKIWSNVMALWALAKDPNAAWGSKAIAIGALVYLVSPIDLIPDVIPFVGLTDDAGVIIAAIANLAVELNRYRGDDPNDVQVHC